MGRIIKWLDQRNTIVKVFSLFIIAIIAVPFIFNKKLSLKWDKMVEDAFDEQKKIP